MRLSTACDQCKSRKVKCDGTQPCNHCKRRSGEICHYAISHKRPRLEARPLQQAPVMGTLDLSPRLGQSAAQDQIPEDSFESHQASAQPNVDDEETVVPRDSRLLQDAQGKLMFIGDCAPLSFLQSVRQLITQVIDPNAFANNNGQDALLEQPIEESIQSGSITPVSQDVLQKAISTFLACTSGLLEIDSEENLHSIVTASLANDFGANDVASAVSYLVLAIGLQDSDEQHATSYYNKARSIATSHLTFDTSPSTVQAFLLISIYMLRNCQPNGAFLYFGLAARASYSIGMHRSEVNARFGPEAEQQRQRLYKSLKVADLFISICLGRPPALYDLDCTVAYKSARSDECGQPDMLDDTLQILLIVESIVVEVYGRRKISLQLTRQISQKLKDWASPKIPELTTILARIEYSGPSPMVTGAVQALATYYYAVMLLSKPFLMYEAYQRLGKVVTAASRGKAHRSSTKHGRTMVAEGCVDAACCLVDLVYDIAEKGKIPHKMPLIVSWLFTASLVLGVALAADFGRVMERYLKHAISTLDYFSKHDAQALQYSQIARSLLSTCVEYVQRRDIEERIARGKASSELFGLSLSPHRNVDPTYRPPPALTPSELSAGPPTSAAASPNSAANTSTPIENWDELDFGGFDQSTQELFGSLNLFPIFDADTVFEPTSMT